MILTSYKTTFLIIAVDTVAKTFTVAGDKRDIFNASSTPSVEGSTGNDGGYSVVSSTLDGTDTVVTVNEVIPSAVADGSLALILGKDTTEWNRDDLGGNEPFVAESTVGAGRVDISSPVNWDKYGISASLDDRGFRNEMIALGNTSALWGALVLAERQALVRNYAYWSGASTADLDACYDSTTRFDYKKAVMEVLRASCECDPHRSSLAGSEKYFNWTNDDGGVMDSGTEILSDAVL